MEMPNLAKEIHAAMFSAADVLLQEQPYDHEQVDALVNMGFTASENVADFNDHHKNHTYAQEYRQRYPHYRFITEHQFRKVCKRYSLQTGIVDRFKGSIPQKNVTDLMNCRIMGADIHHTRFWIDNADPEPIPNPRFVGISHRTLNAAARWFHVSPEELSMDLQMGVISRDQILMAVGNSNDLSALDVRDLHSAQWLEFVTGKTAPEYSRSGVSRPAPSEKMLTFSQLKHRHPTCVGIAAHRDLFERPAPDLDPIVGVSVRGGILVITAWGDEAADPDIVNAAMN